MRPTTLAVATAAAFLALGAAAAHAECTRVASDVVSIGQKNARAYSQRSLAAAIEGEQQRLKSAGLVPGHVTRGMACKPYPNVIGADEWQCQGSAKVCSK
jgi:hypothetical protein